MNNEYKEIHKIVRNMRFNAQDWLDDHNHQLGQALKREVQRLEDEIESSKNPRSLEDRVKGIQRNLREIGDNSQVMDNHHSDDLHDRLEDLRMQLRGLSNY